MNKQIRILILAMFFIIGFSVNCGAEQIDVSLETQRFITGEFSNTNSYDRYILEDDLEKAEIMLQRCSKSERKADKFLNTIPYNNKRDMQCITDAYLIIAHRALALEDFCLMKKAEIAKNADEEQKHQEVMYKNWRIAKDLRTKFFDKYGF